MAQDNKIIRIAALCCGILLISCFVGCSNLPPKTVPPQCVVLKDKLENYIVQKPTAPDYVMKLKIPHSDLFNSSSANFRSGITKFNYGAKKTLKQLSSFLSCYQIEDLQVVSHVHVQPGANLSHYQSLANEQAQRVGNYFWHNDRNVRIIHPYGVLEKITENNSTNVIELIFQPL